MCRNPVPVQGRAVCRYTAAHRSKPGEGSERVRVLFPGPLLEGNAKVRTFQLIATGSLLVFIALSQAPVLALDDDERMLLKRELVVHGDGKYTHEQINLCRVRLPGTLGGGYTNPFYVKRHIESPAELMSRDRFVALSTRIVLTNRVVFAHSFSAKISVAEAFDAVKCTSITAPQESVDFEISVVMRSDGIQVRILDTASGKKSLDTLSWAKMLNL
jgi:hypothetical protein